MAETLEAEAEAEPKPAGGNKKLIIIVAVSVFVVLGAAIGVTLALTGKSEPTADGAEGPTAKAPAESMYVELKPEFVINFRDRNDRPKFLKAEMSVSTSDEDVVEAVQRHMPAIRNGLVLLLSRQIYDDLVPHEGKEKLRAEALAEVQTVLESEIGQSGVDDLYFSNFVMH